MPYHFLERQERLNVNIPMRPRRLKNDLARMKGRHSLDVWERNEALVGGNRRGFWLKLRVQGIHQDKDQWETHNTPMKAKMMHL